jgi:outer membrane receptor protein involved in Fe transport
LGCDRSRFRNLQTTIAYWFLASDSELVFDGDTGDTVANPASLRYGLEISNYYTPFPWLTINADFAASQARYNATNPAGRYVEEAASEVADAGILVHDLAGREFGLRWRYFGPRHLTANGAINSSATSLFYLRLGYQFSPNWSIGVDVYNLLNTRAQDIAYYYASRLKFEPPGPDNGGYNDIEFHPAESRSVRVTLTARF